MEKQKKAMKILYLLLSTLIILLDVYFFFVLPSSIFYRIFFSAFGTIGIVLLIFTTDKHFGDKLVEQKS